MQAALRLVALASSAWLSLACELGAPLHGEALPAPTLAGGFATSDTCRACHPGAYASWHDSYHRTMTQVARPEIVVGDFDDVTLTDRGHTTRLSRRDGAMWVDTPDPAWFMDPDPNKPPPPRIEQPVVMTTGSHHMQYYWIRRPAEGRVHGRPDHGALVAMPWVWLIEEARWIPVQDSFLTPPNPHPETPRWWNNACFQCHSVATRPGYDAAQDTFASQTVELGIACEACHGPAEDHIAANRSPLTRYLKYFDGEAGDPTIVNPARLDAPRSRDVCGQCHSVGEPRDFGTFSTTGVAFRAGDRLDASQHSYRLAAADAQAPEDPAATKHDVGTDFWSDGTIRVAGREYNGLLETGCATRGELTCLSCHAMHDYREPANQLTQAGSNAACGECHADVARDVPAHTHHAIDSPGSDCLNCHMPHTTYGLFAAMRSHRIDSPSAAVQAETGRPNACNLCHLDQTLEWTNQSLHAWYEQPIASLDEDDRNVAASVLWALRGDAAQRGIAAWHMGWEPARQASGQDWIGTYLALLLDDPYVAVRRVAERSLETLPGFEAFPYDFIAPPAERARMQGEALSRLQRSRSGVPDRFGRRLLVDELGGLDRGALERLYLQRDDSPIRISE